MSKRILIAPLDWGLGHTTRCIPIIKHLFAMGHTVLFAGNTQQQTYIAATLEGVEMIDLDGYDVRYAKTKAGFMFSIFKQVPRLLSRIQEEHEWLKGVVEEYKIDVVISDNRYGLYHKDVQSIIMTHQLQPISGLGKIVNDMVRDTHYKYLNNFDKIWVVDIEGHYSLAGKMSHPKKLPNKNVEYIGWLSQLENHTKAKHEHLAIILSGPEPQRTKLSDKLWEQAKEHKGNIVFIEGSENIAERTDIPEHITYHKRLTRKELNVVFIDASMVVCRSGYSTLMDLVTLQKKAVLIATPGQTEQEYLARTLNKVGVFMSVKQKKFDLVTALTKASEFPFRKIVTDDYFELYKKALKEI